VFGSGAMRQLLGLMESYWDVLDWMGGNVEIDDITPAPQQVMPGYIFVLGPGPVWSTQR
jgi:hypothetical protein